MPSARASLAQEVTWLPRSAGARILGQGWLGGVQHRWVGRPACSREAGEPRR